MTAIIASTKDGEILRLAEDHDSTPTATWVERFKRDHWEWETMTTQPIAEVLQEYNGKGFVALAIEE